MIYDTYSHSIHGVNIHQQTFQLGHFSNRLKNTGSFKVIWCVLPNLRDTLPRPRPNLLAVWNNLAHHDQWSALFFCWKQTNTDTVQSEPTKNNKIPADHHVRPNYITMLDSKLPFLRWFAKIGWKETHRKGRKKHRNGICSQVHTCSILDELQTMISSWSMQMMVNVPHQNGTT